MSHALWTVSLSVLGTLVKPAKTVEQIEMPLRGHSAELPREHCSRWAVQIPSKQTVTIKHKIQSTNALRGHVPAHCKPIVKYSDYANLGMRRRCGPLPNHFGHFYRPQQKAIPLIRPIIATWRVTNYKTLSVRNESLCRYYDNVSVASGANLHLQEQQLVHSETVVGVWNDLWQIMQYSVLVNIGAWSPIIVPCSLQIVVCFV